MVVSVKIHGAMFQSKLHKVFFKKANNDDDILDYFKSKTNTNLIHSPKMINYPLVIFLTNFIDQKCTVEVEVVDI